MNTSEMPLISSIQEPIRQSNFELLRIFSMTLVLLSHFLWFGVTEDSISPRLFYFLVPLVACGVNLFFMISGWFKIRFSVQAILKLAFTILLFQIVNRIMLITVGVDGVWNKIYTLILFPISHSSYWFIKVYLFLIITAPLMNLGLDNMPLKTLRKFMAIFCFFTFYSCAIGGNISNTNYCYMQGMLMYCLGYYLHKDYVLYSKISLFQTIVIGTFLIFLCAAATSYTRLLGLFTTYNSAFLVATSFVTFLAFSKLTFRSRIINYIAGSALGCYLLQDGCFGWRFMYSWMHEVFISSDIILNKILIYVAVFIGTWILSLIVSPIIKYIVSHTINFLSAHIQIPFFNKI